jgi:hypothetical protein
MAITKTTRANTEFGGNVLRAIVVGLALASAAVHASLGGWLFLMNAAGYATLGLAMALPGPAERLRWLVRLALAAFTLATLAGWVLFGARYQMAYVANAIEICLLAAIALEIRQRDGGLLEVGRRLRGHIAEAIATVAPRAR